MIEISESTRRLAIDSVGYSASANRWTSGKLERDLQLHVNPLRMGVIYTDPLNTTKLQSRRICTDMQMPSTDLHKIFFEIGAKIK